MQTKGSQKGLATYFYAPAKTTILSQFAETSAREYTVAAVTRKEDGKGRKLGEKKG
jgi:hypothetical protein